jgi:aminoglycoside 6'-N-acetyltransferase
MIPGHSHGAINPGIVLRPATLADVRLFERWDRQPHVISATTDDPAAERAFEDARWSDELAAQDEHNRYLIADLDGRSIGAMQVIDPQQESTHYWGAIRANLRAIDIWIGEPDCLGKGYGEIMMRLAFQLCFADPAVVAIVIDPLASNVRAHKFYRRLGFKPTGLRKFGDDECLVHELTREGWHTRFATDAAACRLSQRPCVTDSGRH